MTRFNRIVLPTDFRLNADHAAKYARALAKKGGGEIHLVHVVDSRPFFAGRIVEAGMDDEMAQEVLEQTVEHAKEKLEPIAVELEDAGIEVFRHVLTGAAAPAIVNQAWGLEADLIVSGTHGRRGFERLMLGSTCEEVIRTSPVPVLSIKHPEHEFVKGDGDAVELDRVLCACDFSQFSRRAVPYAAELCRTFGATLELIHVVHPIRSFVEEYLPSWEDQRPFEARSALASLEELAEGLQDVHPELTVLSGNPAEILTSKAGKESADVIVMTTHGRSGLQRVVMGSVVEKVVRMAPCPVLTIRPVETVEDEAPDAEHAAQLAL